jgi:hypothetical protein
MTRDNSHALTTSAILLGSGLAAYAAGRWLAARTQAGAPEPDPAQPAPEPSAAAVEPRDASPHRRNASPEPRSHRDVEFAIDDESGDERIFRSFDEAAGFAVGLAVSTGKRIHLDVLVYSRDGAGWWGGEDGEHTYDDDPDASVFERLVIEARSDGAVA